MHGGHADVRGVARFGTLEAEREAGAAHQAVGVVEAVVRTVGQDEVVGIDVSVGQFNLRFEVEGLRQVEAPAEFTGERGDDVVHRALLAAVHRHVGRSLAETSHDVDELTGFTHPESVGREAEGVHVGFAASIFGVAHRVGQSNAEARRVGRRHRADTDLNGVEVVFEVRVAGELAAVITRPDAGGRLHGADVAHALVNVVDENAVERKGSCSREFERGLHDAVGPAADGGAGVRHVKGAVVHAFVNLHGRLDIALHVLVQGRGLFGRDVVGRQILRHVGVLELDGQVGVLVGLGDRDRTGLLTFLSRQIGGKIDRTAVTRQVVDSHLDVGTRDIDGTAVENEVVHIRIDRAVVHNIILNDLRRRPLRAVAERKRQIMDFKLGEVIRLALAPGHLGVADPVGVRTRQIDIDVRVDTSPGRRLVIVEIDVALHLDDVLAGLVDRDDGFTAGQDGVLALDVRVAVEFDPPLGHCDERGAAGRDVNALRGVQHNGSICAFDAGGVVLGPDAVGTGFKTDLFSRHRHAAVRLALATVRQQRNAVALALDGDELRLFIANLGRAVARCAEGFAIVSAIRGRAFEMNLLTQHRQAGSIVVESPVLVRRDGDLLRLVRADRQGGDRCRGMASCCNVRHIARSADGDRLAGDRAGMATRNIQGRDLVFGGDVLRDVGRGTVKREVLSLNGVDDEQRSDDQGKGCKFEARHASSPLKSKKHAQITFYPKGGGRVFPNSLPIPVLQSFRNPKSVSIPQHTERRYFCSSAKTCV